MIMKHLRLISLITSLSRSLEYLIHKETSSHPVKGSEEVSLFIVYEEEISS